jgi:hypothetical protein
MSEQPPEVTGPDYSDDRDFVTLEDALNGILGDNSEIVHDESAEEAREVDVAIRDKESELTELREEWQRLQAMRTEGGEVSREQLDIVGSTLRAVYSEYLTLTEPDDETQDRP